MAPHRRKKRLWALVGWWHGAPCAIQRGEYVPPFSTWMECSTRREWEELRSEGFYTRRSDRRPTELVDRDFQRTTPTVVER